MGQTSHPQYFPAYSRMIIFTILHNENKVPDIKSKCLSLVDAMILD